MDSSRVGVKRMLWVVLAQLLITSVFAEEPDYFPLQIGNRWVYRCVHHIPPDYVCGIEGQGCFCSEGAILGMTVTDTIRLDLSSIPEPTRFTEMEVPVSSDGTLYYVLRGSMVSLFGPITSSDYRDAGMLVRKGTSSTRVWSEGIRPDDVQLSLEQALLLGGWALNAGWEIAGLERLLGDFIPTRSYRSFNDMIYAEYQMDGVWNHTLLAPAGRFTSLSFIGVQPGCVCGDPYNLLFAPNVGMVGISASEPSDFNPDHLYYVLTEAEVAGVRYSSTDIQPLGWAQIKDGFK